MMLAEAVEKVEVGKYKNFSMTPEERYELYIASWLHDCGKVATPPHIVDKSTKLEAIFDRIELVNHRMEILKRDAEIEFLKRQLRVGKIKEYDKKYIDRIKQIDDNMKFLRSVNYGGEFMLPEKQDRVREISSEVLKIDGKNINILSDEEVENLNIPKLSLIHI